MMVAVSVLNGSPFFKHDNTKLNANQIWNIIKTHDIDTDIMTAGTEIICDAIDPTPDGLSYCHAYTVLAHLEL